MIEIRWLIESLKGYKKYIFIGLTISIISALLVMINPILIGKIVQDVLTGGKKSMLFPLLGGMIGVSLVKSILRYGMQGSFEYASQNTFKRNRDNLYKKLQTLDFSYFDRNGTGDLMAKIISDTETVRNFTAAVIFTILENILIFIFAIIVVATINWQLMLILLLMAPVIAVVTYKFSKKVKPIFVKIREQYTSLNSVVQENISGNRVVKAYTREDYEIEKFDKQNDEYMNLNIQASNTSAKFSPILDSLSSFVIFLFLLSGGIFVYKGYIEMWQFVTINGYMAAIINPMRVASQLINETQRFFISADRIIQILRTQPLVENPQNPCDHIIEGTIEFKNVSFGYPGEKIILHDISFKAHKGQTIAIVGPTGSGKTTISSLISRFYDVTAGQILIDDIDIKDYSIHNLRSKIGVAMQDVFLFSDTVEGNIAYGVPEISFDNVLAAAKIAGADGFIRKMPEGYDTIVGERGVGLSGGQRQRLALARVLCKDPAILILDDTTSAVDLETERSIQNALTNVLKEKTAFIIAHRISSVKHADLILVIENGRITEHGTHQELVDKKGYYYNIFQTQSGIYDEQEETIRKVV